MEKFIGTKIVQAEPACRLTLQKLGGPEMVVTVEEVEANIEAAEESGLGLVRKQEGYKVVYEPDGYESWSPKEVFEAAYRRTDGMNFGLALEAAKMGKRIARKGWNGKGMYVEVSDLRFGEAHSSGDVRFLCLIDTNANKKTDLCWQPAMEDIFADDWYIVEV